MSDTPLFSNEYLCVLARKAAEAVPEQHRKDALFSLLADRIEKLALRPEGREQEWIEGAPPKEQGIDKYKPGQRLRLADGRVLLVGDLNTMGGGCDCCRMDETIVAYKSSPQEESQKR